MTSPRPTKSQGQWALGEREPLNPNEQFKKDDDALNVRDRILNHYSKAGFDSIEKNDLRGRMRWALVFATIASVCAGPTALSVAEPNQPETTEGIDWNKEREFWSFRRPKAQARPAVAGRRSTDGRRRGVHV